MKQDKKNKYVVRKLLQRDDTGLMRYGYGFYLELTREDNSQVYYEEIDVPIFVDSLKKVNKVKDWLKNGTKKTLLNKYVNIPEPTNIYYKDLSIECIDFIEVKDCRGTTYELSCNRKSGDNSVLFFKKKKDALKYIKSMIDSRGLSCYVYEYKEIEEIEEFYSSNDYLSHEE